MKKKDKQAIQAMTEVELRRQIGQVSRELMENAVARFTKQEKNQRVRTALRLKRAVMATVLREKELSYGQKQTTT